MVRYVAWFSIEWVSIRAVYNTCSHPTVIFYLPIQSLDLSFTQDDPQFVLICSLCIAYVHSCCFNRSLLYYLTSELRTPPYKGQFQRYQWNSLQRGSIAFLINFGWLCLHFVLHPPNISQICLPLLPNTCTCILRLQLQLHVCMHVNVCIHVSLFAYNLSNCCVPKNQKMILDLASKRQELGYPEEDVSPVQDALVESEVVDEPVRKRTRRRKQGRRNARKSGSHR